jgi:beta-lactam-binding protein with PASTA domain
VVPDLRGLSLRQALRTLNGLPVGVETEGSGVVIGVEPAPGTTIADQSVIRLTLEALP